MFADVTFSTEGIVVISALLAALVAAVGVLYKELRAGSEARLGDVRSQRDSYKEMAEEALESIEVLARLKWQKDGGRVPDPLAPVVAEHHSPTTQRQQDTADLQTMRARLVAATLALGLPARPAARPATAAEERQKKGG